MVQRREKLLDERCCRPVKRSKTTSLVQKFLRDEGGFTLSEMLVTMMIMIVVLFALYNVFDMSIRVFSFGNAKIESTENARVALGRMEREIRAAYPLDAPTSEQRINPVSSSATQIVFYNDLSNNASPAFNDDGKGTGDKETIRYSVSNGNLMRQQGGASAPPSPAQPLAPLGPVGPGGPSCSSVSDGPYGCLEFVYLDKISGAPISLPLTAAKEKTIGMVRIRLVVVEENAENDPQQELITNVALRNRGT